MDIIRDKFGNVKSRSQNLRGIHRAVSHQLVKLVAIDQLADGEGKLCILFDNGDSFETNFASYTVLARHVRQWRNIQGAHIVINTVPSGMICRSNNTLAAACE